MGYQVKYDFKRWNNMGNVEVGMELKGIKGRTLGGIWLKYYEIVKIF